MAADVPGQESSTTSGGAVRSRGSVEALAEGVRRGDRRAVAKLITALEREEPGAEQVLHSLHGAMGGAHIVGITGSPGTGKSTLTDGLIQHYRRMGKKVGVVAVDPSSPFTGGAILGDRIRMQGRTGDPDVFIRSMGTRGALGGLSRHTYEAVQVLDAAGKDIVFVETVGVGQAEVDVVRLADTVLVVLVPNLGDDVQAVKAGIMEIADVFVVNKADLTGADKVAAEVEASVGLAHPEEEDWWPPIVRTVAERGRGVPELADALEAHKTWSQRTGAWDRRRSHRLRDQVRRLLEREVVTFAFGRDGQVRPPFAALVDQAQAGAMSPAAVAEKILSAFRSADMGRDS